MSQASSYLHQTQASMSTYDRLLHDLPSLSAELRPLVSTILQGTDSMDPSHIDMFGREDGVRWWKIEPDGSKRLYYECFQVCCTSERYKDLAPQDVSGMVDALLASDHTTRHRMARYTLAKAIVQDSIERKQTSNGISLLMGQHQVLTPEAAQAVHELANVFSSAARVGAPDVEALYDVLMPTLTNTPAPGRLKQKRSARNEDNEDGEVASETENSVKGSSRRSTRKREAKRAKYRAESDDEEGRDSKRVLRSREKTDMMNLEAENTAGEAHAKLAPGKRFYRWSNGRLRAHRNILLFSEVALPGSALKGSLHELESSCTPSSVDISLCNFDISVEEILTYFPSHTLWREVCWRVSRRWPAVKVIEFIYWTRDLHDKKASERSTLQHRYRKARQWAEDLVKDRQQGQTTAGLDQQQRTGIVIQPKPATVKGPNPRANMSRASQENGNMGCDKVDPCDYYVCDLSEGVHLQRRPIGRGAQLLTRVLEHAEQNGKKDLLLGGVLKYARDHGIAVPQGDRLSSDIVGEDAAALKRHQTTIDDFYMNRFKHTPL